MLIGASSMLVVFTAGICVNALLVRRCLRKQNWVLQSNIKYLIAAQGFLDTINIAIHFLLVLSTTTSSPLAVLCHPIFPVIVVVFLSLGVFNLTAVVVLKHRQVLSNFVIHRRTLVMTTGAVLGSTLLILWPAFMSRSAVLVFGCEKCGCQVMATQSPTAFNIIPMDVSLYVTGFLIFQFVVPAAIISNRLVMLVMAGKLSSNSIFSANTEIAVLAPPSVSLQSQHVKHHGIINAATIIATVFVSLVIIGETNNLRDSLDPLQSLNNIFNTMGVLTVSLFCFPLYLFDLLDLELNGAVAQINATSPAKLSRVNIT